MTLSFQSPLVAQEYLTLAPPESVYTWLISNAGEPTSIYDSPFSSELLTALLSRNEQIVNLGVATVATDPDILKQLWKSSNPAIRTAIAANIYRDRGFLAIRPYRWTEPAELTAALEEGHLEFVRAWCTNPVLARDTLTDALSKTGVYQHLSEPRWMAVIYWALQNPNLRKPRVLERFSIDGYGEYQEGRPFTAAWSLLITLPNTRECAALICDQFGKLGEFCAPYETLIKKETVHPNEDPEKRQQQHREGELLFLEHVIHKWSADASADPKAREDNGEEDFIFRMLRENIAAAVPTFQSELQDFLKNHSDVCARRGYYRNVRAHNPDEIARLFERDGKHFLEAAVYNDNLYAIQPKGVRATFKQLVQSGAKDLTFEDHQMLRAQWDHRATHLFGEHPARFPDPAAWPDDEEDEAKGTQEGGDGWSQRLEEMEPRIAQLLGKFMTPTDHSTGTEGEQRRAAAEMVLLIGKMNVEISKKIEEINKIVKRNIEGVAGRIERKLNFFGEIVCGAIGLGAGYLAYKIVSSDLGFGDWIGYLAGIAAFAFVGAATWRGFRKGE